MQYAIDRLGYMSEILDLECIHYNVQYLEIQVVILLRCFLVQQGNQ